MSDDDPLTTSDTMMVEPVPARPADPPPELIRRVNQLYHELTQNSFDDGHRLRHRVERPFWDGVARILRGERMRRSRIVVDLACGTGFVSEALLPALRPDDRMIAMDISWAALRTTTTKLHPLLLPVDSRATFTAMTCDAERLPLADGSVDLVALNAALHHMPQPTSTLREIDRVLRPGGRFALGFEPNRTHFASPAMARLARGISQAAWYASPRQNRRRLLNWLGGAAGEPATAEDDVLASVINEQLVHDGLVTRSLSTQQILDLVDPHARSTTGTAGLDDVLLLREAMPHYGLERFLCSDYLGETARFSPRVRGLVDGVMRTLLPRHGSLFSWIVRKPDDAHRKETHP